MRRATNTTRSTHRPHPLGARAVCSAIAILAAAVPLTGCTGGDSPRSSFYRARSLGVQAQPGNGVEISVVTRAPVGTVQETGVVVRRFE